MYISGRENGSFLTTILPCFRLILSILGVVLDRLVLARAHCERSKKTSFGEALDQHLFLSGEGGRRR